MNRASIIVALAGALLSLSALAGPVDINTADAKTLARELKGIGLSRAQAIVDYREKNGPFKSADDLAKVKGVGMKVVDENRSNIRIEKTEKARAGGKQSEKATSPD